MGTRFFTTSIISQADGTVKTKLRCDILVRMLVFNEPIRAAMEGKNRTCSAFYKHRADPNFYRFGLIVRPLPRTVELLRQSKPFAATVLLLDWGCYSGCGGTCLRAAIANRSKTDLGLYRWVEYHSFFILVVLESRLYVR